MKNRNMFPSWVMTRSEQHSYEVDLLLQYGTNITSQAHLETSDRVIGREKEIERVIQVLLKREKSNACLIGDPGVGKTAIVEALARRIADAKVPAKLRGKKVFSIDVARLVAGLVLHGDLEARLKDLVDQAQRTKGGVILFVDELHTLIQAGNAYTSILKPALARGDLKLICATTVEGYRKYMEQEDAAFECIQIPEPSRDESIAILEGSKHKYEFHHRALYTRLALIHAVDLSARYITELRLPGKAINLMDEAGARAHMLGLTRVTTAHVEHVVSAWTGIPLTKLTPKESRDLSQLHQALKRSVIGQDEAVAAVTTCIHRARLGIRDETKPVGCFLFTGPTGVGKTEMAKVLAAEYFDSREAMVRLDMSEYMEPHNVSRMIGSPPGYLGHEQGGQLTELVHRRPHSLVLLDEIEKADGKVLNVLLQILDDGRLTDGKGRTVDFRNTIIILTSNIVGSQAMRARFSPELLNRFDQVVVFNPLEKEHVWEILEIMLNKVSARVADRKKIKLAFSKELKEMLILQGYDQTYGARALNRTITRLVQDKLAQEILNGSVAESQTVTMDVDSAGEVVIWNWR